MKRIGKKKIVLLLMAVILLIALSLGIFALVGSYRMSHIPSMSLEEMLAYTTKDQKNAIITLGIIQNGEVDFTVYGENATILPSHEFSYEIGSVTKTFTTALLCKTIEEGKAQLSDSIDKYIKLGQYDHYPTLQQLATHTSGYKNYYFDWQMAANTLGGQDNDYFGIPTDKLKDTLGRIETSAEDHPFVYSNFGISLIGNALAHIYDKNFTSIMNNFIKTELELKHTHISDGTGDLSGYWQWKPDDAYIPAGALISTIGDMLQYVQLHLQGKLSYLSLGHEPQAQVHVTSSLYEKMGIRVDAIGLGWMIDDQRKILWHNGATSNFNSYVAFDTQRQLGVVVLSNLPPNYRIPATVLGIQVVTALQNQTSRSVGR